MYILPSHAIIKGIFVVFILFAIMPSTHSQYTLPGFEGTPAPEMPTGIFSYHKSETALKNQFGVPESELSDPMSIASELINTAVAESSSKQQALAGVNIPLPFRLKPLNFKLSQDSETRMGMSPGESESVDAERPEATSNRRRSPTSADRAKAALSSEAQMALAHARRICLEGSQRNCDAALEEYQKLRLGQSPRERENRIREAQPNEWTEYVQTGLAKWLVPGLDRKLDEIVLESTTPISKTTVSPTSTTPKPVKTTTPPINRRRKPIRLPTRNPKTTMPPRIKPETDSTDLQTAQLPRRDPPISKLSFISRQDTPEAGQIVHRRRRRRKKLLALPPRN
uniref:DUF1311 domain-containing protein n=1 Tax=Panagrellus redivivus TaxID=6233 RepID=A0A7E4VRL1_PANRE